LTPRCNMQRRDLTHCCIMQRRDLTTRCIMQRGVKLAVNSNNSRNSKPNSRKT
jgi:hypothetical protein